MKTIVIQFIFFLFSFISFSQTMVLDKIKCKVNLEDTEKIKQMIEFQSNYYEALFHIKIKPIRIKLFGKLRMYKKVRDSITNLDTETGFYSGKMKTIYVYKSETFLRTIYHEINHAIVRQKLHHVPSWINEGMAEFFEYFTVNSSGVSIKMQHFKLTKTKKWVEENKINLQELLNYSYSQWHKKNRNPSGYSYTVSYSFVCYLFLRHPGAIGTILKHIKNGKNSIEAIEIVTKKKIELIENDFKAFL